MVWTEEKWQDYYYLADNIVDAAVLWKEGSYIPNTYMCVSFQFKKHLSPMWDSSGAAVGFGAPGKAQRGT